MRAPPEILKSCTVFYIRNSNVLSTESNSKCCHYAFSEQVKYCLFLQGFRHFVEQTSEIFDRKWNTGLLEDLFWIFGQYVITKTL